MTIHTAPTDTYAQRLDTWLADQKDAMAAHIAENGTAVFTAEDYAAAIKPVSTGPQLDLVDSVNQFFIKKEFDELEGLLFAVKSLGVIDHTARVHAAIMGRDQKWRDLISPWISDARQAVASDVTDPKKLAVIDREIARRLHEVFDHTAAVYRGEDTPHSLMSDTNGHRV